LSAKSAKSAKGSNGSAASEEAALRRVLERIKLMRREFEELLFLRHAAETLRDFRRRLLRERWD
jgi:phage terminase large subunit